jgi:hypothetical protein
MLSRTEGSNPSGSATFFQYFTTNPCQVEEMTIGCALVIINFMSIVSHDWWLEGFDPIKKCLLVRCRTTKETGIVPDPTPHEMIEASVVNFTPCAWVQHARVQICEVESSSYELARETQRVSLFRKTQPLSRVRVE